MKPLFASQIIAIALGLCSVAFAPPGEPETVRALVRHIYEYYPEEPRLQGTRALLRGISAYLDQRTARTIPEVHEWRLENWESAARRSLVNQVLNNTVISIEQLRRRAPFEILPKEFANILAGDVPRMAATIEAMWPSSRWANRETLATLHRDRNQELNRRLLIHALWLFRPRPWEGEKRPRHTDHVRGLWAEGQFAIPGILLAFDYYRETLWPRFSEIPWASGNFDDAYDVEKLPDMPLPQQDFALRPLHPVLGMSLELESRAEPFLAGRSYYQQLPSPTYAHLFRRRLARGNAVIYDMSSNPHGIAPSSEELLFAELQPEAYATRERNRAERPQPGLALIRVIPAPMVLTESAEKAARLLTAFALMERWDLQRRVRLTQPLDARDEQDAERMHLSLSGHESWKALRGAYEAAAPKNENLDVSATENEDILERFLLSANAAWIGDLFASFTEFHQRLLVRDLVHYLGRPQRHTDPVAIARGKQLLLDVVAQSKGATRHRFLDVLQRRSLAGKLSGTILTEIERLSTTWTRREKLRVAWLIALHRMKVEMPESDAFGAVARELFLSTNLSPDAFVELAVWRLLNPPSESHAVSNGVDTDAVLSKTYHPTTVEMEIAQLRQGLRLIGRTDFLYWVFSPLFSVPVHQRGRYLDAVANAAELTLEDLVVAVRLLRHVTERIHMALPGMFPKIPAADNIAQNAWEALTEGIVLRAHRDGNAPVLDQLFGDDYDHFKSILLRVTPPRSTGRLIPPSFLSCATVLVGWARLWRVRR